MSGLILIQTVWHSDWFKKDNFEKNQQMTKKHARLPSMQRVLSEYLESAILLPLISGPVSSPGIINDMYSNQRLNGKRCRS